MKRDIGVLNEYRMQGIKEWLELDSQLSRQRCPFIMGLSCNRTTCQPLFPFKDKPKCPCECYDIKYVRRVAKQLIKAWEKKHG